MRKWGLKSALAKAASAAGKAYEKADELAEKAKEKALPVAASALKTAYNGAAGMTAYLGEKTIGKYQDHKDDIQYPTAKGEPLTKAEAALLKSIFGDEIDTDKVKKYFSDKEHPYLLARACNGEKIKFYGKNTRVPDYSLTQDASNYFTFVHEMAHVWQLQHPKEDILRDLHNPTRKNNYTLSETSRFQDFGVEQQACIIADYAFQCLFSGKTRPANLSHAHYLPMDATDEKPQNLGLLYKTVEDRFPQARLTRMKRKPARKPPAQGAKTDGPSK